MTRRTWIYDHDLDSLVQVRGPETNHPTEPRHGVEIIRDIEPYRTAAGDIAADGGQVTISSRSRHREFLHRNRYVETGNEVPISGEKPRLSSADRINDLRRALGDFGSNVGGPPPGWRPG